MYATTTTYVPTTGRVGLLGAIAVATFMVSAAWDSASAQKKPQVDSFTKITRPGAVDTLPSGINEQGWISGTSETAKQAAASTEEGFLLQEENEYRTIFFPGAFDTDLGKINDRGVIIGTDGSNSKPFRDRCFTWSQKDGYEPFAIPLKNAFFPDCNGINERGDKVGSFVTDCAANDPNCNFSGTPHGFLITKEGRERDFHQLDASFPGVTGTEAFGINERGDIVGSFTRAGPDGAFLLRNGKYTEITVPNATSVDAYAINDRGDIVGSYTDSKGDHGFVLSDGVVTTVDVPFKDAFETNKVTDINEQGWMVGVYTADNVTGPEKGFKARFHPDR
jgi:uncharacterized membrane protein